MRSTAHCSASGANPRFAAAQAFYWMNWVHDRLYALGFTEAAGNFQADNLGRGGLGGDLVRVFLQDPNEVDNASYSHAPDGQSPDISFGLWNSTATPRDSALDATVVIHEYVHGLSSRLVGGGGGLGGAQAGGMGEGWSDFYALSLLSESGEDPAATYPVGAYSMYQSGGFTQNYYYGSRRYPYTTDLAKNPLTFKDVDPGQASAHSSVPLSPLFLPFRTNDASEVHSVGEVWCAMLWDMRANLVAKHGFATGNQLALQLVTDGMRLTPVSPSFLQACDAILQADFVNTGGDNFYEISAAFAKRGLGRGRDGDGLA